MTPFGERAIRFAVPEGAARVSLLARLRRVEGVRDVILAEELGCVVFREKADHARAEIAQILTTAADDLGGDAPAPRTHEIDVVYDGEDLDAVAAAIGKTRDEVVSLHARAEYRVAMLGFLPGFAYLRGLPEALRLPRRAPRPRVPKNSVAIAADYAGVYPFASPGGWHLLGTALGFEAFGPDGARLATGDVVRFVPHRGGRDESRRAPADRPAPTAPVAESPPGRPHLEIVRAAGFALLVDRGRWGHMHEGVPPGGPLVGSAFARANAHAGNPPAACAVEVYGSLEVVARGGALTIADDERRVRLAEGDRHAVSTVGGARVRYLAVPGGVEAPVVLGSRGALLVAAIGHPLRKGDRLVPCETPSASSSAEIAEPAEAAPMDAPIELDAGPDTVDGWSLDALTEHVLTVSPSSDRTGVRLEGGPSLGATTRPHAMSRPSAPMVLGAIELTPSGLIVLGPDHPTTGGYPVVAVVREASLDALFAKKPGADVRFRIAQPKAGAAAPHF